MKTLLKIIGAIILIYTFLVLGLWAIGICPSYVNKVPSIGNGTSLSSILYDFKLCPFSQVAY